MVTVMIDGKKKKMFCYGLRRVRKILDEGCIAVSEKPLPRNTDINGRCARHGKRINNRHVGEIVDVAIGDPRILEKAKIVSFNIKDIPKEIRIISNRYGIITLEWQKAKVWVDKRYICLLKDLK